MQSKGNGTKRSARVVGELCTFGASADLTSYNGASGAIRRVESHPRVRVEWLGTEYVYVAECYRQSSNEGLGPWQWWTYGVRNGAEGREHESVTVSATASKAMREAVAPLVAAYLESDELAGAQSVAIARAIAQTLTYTGDHRNGADTAAWYLERIPFDAISESDRVLLHRAIELRRRSDELAKGIGR